MKKFLIGLMVAVIAVTVFGADNFVQSAGNLLWTNPGADVSSGELVDIGERYAVALVDIASNATGTVKTDGVFEFLRSETNAITIGDPIYYSNATTIKAAGAANVYVGAAAETVSAISTATLAAATAKIRLARPSERLPCNPSIRQTAPTSSRTERRGRTQSRS